MRKLCLLLLAAIAVSLTSVRPAAAVQQFYDAFVKNYIADHPNKEYADMVTKEAKCFVCHQGTKRANRNPFGKEVAKLLNRRRDAKDQEKIADGLKKALAMHVDPKDDKSETFLDRVKAAKLPGGNLEDLKKEPTQSNDKK